MRMQKIIFIFIFSKILIFEQKYKLMNLLL
jgi:hypothetical protein